MHNAFHCRGEGRDGIIQRRVNEKRRLKLIPKRYLFVFFKID